MNAKVLLLFACVYIFGIVLTASQQNNGLKSIKFAGTRDIWGCNGPNNINNHKCRVHCRTRGYRNGQCSPLWNYERCVCVR
ncbi:hypothetical protein I4U23_003732 [Adineta vaga]|nr:hypothetical protein I4U23_003732 [Adineta vaga]